MTMNGCGIYDVAAVGQEPWAPVDGLVLGQLLFSCSFNVIDIELQQVVAGTVAAVNDFLAIRREERTTVIAFFSSNPARVGTIRIHDINLGIAIAERCENNMLAVRRIASLSVVAWGICELGHAGTVRIGNENIHIGIEIPAVAIAAAVSRTVLFNCVWLAVFQSWIKVAGAEQNRQPIGVEIGTSTLACTCRDQFRLGRWIRVLNKNLIVILTDWGGLKDDFFAVGAEITFTSLGKIEGKLADIFEMFALELGDLFRRAFRLSRAHRGLA